MKMEDMGSGDSNTGEFPFDIPLEFDVDPRIGSGPWYMPDYVDLVFTIQAKDGKLDLAEVLGLKQILKAAAARLRELKPLIELLTTPSILSETPSGKGVDPSPVSELELSGIVEGIAETAGTYGGPDYTSIVKDFDPVPLRQAQPFKHNKKHSAELWVVFLLREHFRSLGLGKDRYWPLVAPLCAAAGILQPNGQPYPPDELKSWWQKNWPRTYQQLDQKQVAIDSGGAAYEQDFGWYQAWMNWQRTR